MDSEVEKFLLLACEEAEKGVQCGDGGPFGAAVVKDGQIVAVGHNEVLKTNDPTAHAEVTVIRRAAAKLGTWQLSDCVLYSSCKPCPMCFGATLWSRLQRVYYCLDDCDAAEQGFDDSEFYDIISGRKRKEHYLCCVPLERAKAAMQMWREKPDKTPY
ncbi:dCMP cyt deam 1 domain containing protein [Trichuris trichiura]|uniref:dCMP cyt deam 1 domain containing protein n=1 Tax=Trichuris trichiura TaxID=36087 RepID=A0A077YZB3_TRITR|nr:dCMP cyt deam 1 domain containing protein [Trichuris trichiura]